MNTHIKSILVVTFILLTTTSSYAAEADPFLDADWGWEEVDPLADIKKKIIPPDYYYRYESYKYRCVRYYQNALPESFFNNLAKFLKETEAIPDEDGEYDVPDAALRGYEVALCIQGKPTGAGASYHPLRYLFETDPGLTFSDDPLFCYMLDMTLKPFSDNCYDTAKKQLESLWDHLKPIFLTACKLSRLNLINCFLKKGLVVNINASDCYYHLTALHYACNAGHFELVATLLAKGANSRLIGVFDSKEQTPLDLAKANRAERIVALIEQHRIDFPAQHRKE